MKTTAFVYSSPLSLVLSAAGILGSVAVAQAQPAEPPPAEPPAAEAAPPEAPDAPPPDEPAAEAEAAPAAPPAEEPMPAPATTMPPEAAEMPAPEPVEPEPAPPEPEPAAAPQLPVKLGGSFWSRYELRSGYAEHGLSHPRLHREGDYVVSRARLSVKTTPVDIGDGVMASATFVPQAAYTMGATGTPVTVGDDPGIVLYEGYASVGGSNARLDAGRFALNYGDALILGNLGWNESARSFNGARLHLTPGGSPYYVDVLATIIEEGRGTTLEPIEGDTYLWGLYAGLGPAIAEGLELDAYFLGHTVERNANITLVDPMDDTVTRVGELEAATELTLGSRLKGKASMIDYRLEAGIQFGKSPVSPTFASPAPEGVGKFAYQADLELGLSPAEGFRLALEGLYASGNDPDTKKNEAYNHLYPTAHKFLGFADIVGARSNVASAVLHVKYAANPVTVAVDAHYFSRVKGDPDGSMGTEIDTNLLYALGAGASVRGMYAIFLPNEDFWEAQSASPDDAGNALHYFELQFGYDF